MEHNRFYDSLIHHIDKYFLRRLIVLFVALFVMTLGVSLCIRSQLGSSTISVIPYAWSLAGGIQVGSFTVPDWTVGRYTYIMNSLFVLIQILMLRRHYDPIQLLQLFMGFIFGYFLDITMAITESLQWESIVPNIVQLLVGGLVMAFGISVEVMTRLIMMPGEGITLALSRLTSMEFGKAKIWVDVIMVSIGVGFCFLFFGQWRWDITGLGTLIAMFYVGAMVRLIRPLLRPVQRFLFGESD